MDIASRTKKQTLDMNKLKDKCVSRDNLRIFFKEICFVTENVEFVWTVNDFLVKRKRAKNGSETQIFSDPFYSSKNGYKMCMCIYPDGDLSVKGSYLNACFHIMSGPSDNSLAWPFQYDVTLALIDQKTGIDYRSCTVKYIEMPNNDGWKKPTAQINNGIFAYSIKLNELLSNATLCQNDQIVIKCTVHNVKQR